MTMLTILLPALVSLMGLLLYAFATNPKLSEVGRLAFAVGLLVALLAVGAHPLRLL